jgi:hypothetical protein
MTDDLETTINNIAMRDASAMATRTWLAGQALAGLCANQRVMEKAADKAYSSNLSDLEASKFVVQIAVSMADAALYELAKEKPE